MQPKYDTIGIGYNQTRKADPYLTGRLLHHLNLQGDGLYLDIGCGTGNYTHALQQAGARWMGIDPSEVMLDKARSINPHIDWRTGTAEQTGLPDDFVDGILATLTIHHWPDLNSGFSELFRVLKPGGAIVVFTSTPAQMEGYWLNHYFPQMMADSIRQMPPFEMVADAITSAGFEITATEKYFIQPDLEDHFLYSGKHDPALYFDANIRQGISSFSSLANKEEVTRGLADLWKDIASGKINDIIKAHEKEDGDYLFIVGRRM